ncbi:MAG: RecX family transcriptional regulator [Alloprevotella sp.]|nr:RecX family transcriptional regulator [Alloprevotella sp.]
MKKEITSETLYLKAATLCAHREVCCDDVRQKLYAWGARRDWVDEIVDRLVDEGYIDEMRYARAFVHDKTLFNRWGRVKTRHALEMKNVDTDLIDEALATIDEEAYARMLTELLTEKLPSVSAKNEYERAQKLLRFAAGRGFESSVVFEVMKEL